MRVRAPIASILSVFTLALGIGVNTAIFTVVYGLLFRPFPWPDPDRLVQLSAVRADRAGGLQNFSLPEFEDWQDRSRAFQSLALFGLAPFTLSGGADAQVVRGAMVSDQFFTTLGGPLVAIGRPIGPLDARRAVVIISHRLWLARFNADRGILDRPVTINGQPYVAIGVASPAFQFPADDVDVWVPLSFARLSAPAQWTMRGFRAFSMVGRLKTDVSLSLAAADVRAVGDTLASAYPRFDKDYSAVVTPVRERLSASARPALLLLWAAVGLVLLIACANVTNLTLVRAVSRDREFAIRTALGAGRRRLLTQVLGESGALVGCGTLAGLVLARAGLAFAAALGPASLGDAAVRIDWPVFVYTMAVSAVVTMVVSIAPALRASAVAPIDAMKDSRHSSSARGGRLNSLVVVVEIALSLVLLVGATLVVRALLELVRTPVGVADTRVLTFKLNLTSAVYADSVRETAMLDRVLQELSTLPAVRAVGLASSLPPNVSQMHTTLTTQTTRPGELQDYAVDIVAASSDTFTALGVPLMKGRAFAETDTADSGRVAILSADAARRLFPDSDPVGKPLQIGPSDMPPARIVGVVGNVRYSGLDAPPDGAVYLPYPQRLFRSLYVIMRTNADPMVSAADARRVISRADPDLAISEVRSLDAAIADSVAEPRFRVWLLGVMAALAVTLAMVGLYGVMAHAVSARTAEIGVRMALGADARRIVTMVLRQAAVLVGVGMVTGLAASLLTLRAAAAIVPGLRSIDAVAFALGPACLLLAAFAAALAPALRAGRVDPLTTLRRGQ